MTVACVLPGRPHPASGGLLLCEHHRQELSRWLRDIEDETDRLDPRLSMAVRYDAGAATAPASHRSPAVLDVIAYNDPRTVPGGPVVEGPVCDHCWHDTCRALRPPREALETGTDRWLSVLGALRRWADHVRAHRRITPPVRRVLEQRHARIPGSPAGPFCEPDCRHPSCGQMRLVRTTPAPRTVRTERELLTRHLDWIAAQDWVAQMHAELAGLRDRLLRANHNEPDQPLPGYCYRLVDGAECRGRLWPHDPVHATGYETTDGTRAVVCDRNDEHRWEGPELARLAVILGTQRKDQPA